MCPIITAGMPANTPKQTSEQRPRMKLVIARPLLGVPEEPNCEGPAVVPAAMMFEKAGANSGNSARGFHPGTSTFCARLWRLRRPSAIHWPTCSRLMGPYSLPSVPMILYIAASLVADDHRHWTAAGGRSQRKSKLQLLDLIVQEQPVKMRFKRCKRQILPVAKTPPDVIIAPIWIRIIGALC